MNTTTWKAGSVARRNAGKRPRAPYAFSVGVCVRTNKKQFETEREALAFRKRLRKLTSAKVRPYPCVYCPYWHVGHYRPMATRRINPWKDNPPVKKQRPPSTP